MRLFAAYVVGHFDVFWFSVTLKLMPKSQAPRLSIELVPETCWMSNVRSCVTSADWDTLRRECYKSANHTCEICGGRGTDHPVECHEVWSYSMKTKTQKLERLIALCPTCHEVKHIGLAEMNGRHQIALAHLIIVNGWGMAELKAHYEESFTEWKARSQFQWKLDLSFLDRKGVRYKLDREPTPSEKPRAKASVAVKVTAPRRGKSPLSKSSSKPSPKAKPATSQKRVSASSRRKSG